MSFPNPDWITNEQPQWRPVKGKSDIYVHDDAPSCEAEVIAYACPECSEEKITIHAVCGCKRHGTATDEERTLHATCQQGHQHQPVEVIDGQAQWPSVLAARRIDGGQPDGAASN